MAANWKELKEMHRSDDRLRARDCEDSGPGQSGSEPPDSNESSPQPTDTPENTGGGERPPAPPSLEPPNPWR